MKTHRNVLASLGIALASACAGTSPGLDAAGSPALALGLHNADLPQGGPVDDRALHGVREIHTRIDGVALHYAGGGWQTVAFDDVDVDLLRLSESADALHLTGLPAGRITQIRLFVTDPEAAHVVTAEGNDEHLTVPSGLQSGIKLHGPFDIAGCDARLTLDVDGPRSIRVHELGGGQPDEWILRPVIRVGSFDGGHACAENPPADPNGDDDGTPGNGNGNGNDGTPGNGNGNGGHVGTPGHNGNDGNDGDDGTADPACTSGEICYGATSDPAADPTSDPTTDGTTPGSDLGDVDGSNTPPPSDTGDGQCFNPEAGFFPCPV